MNRPSAIGALLLLASVSVAGLVLAWLWVLGLAVVSAIVLRGRPAFLFFAASMVAVNAILFAWLLPTGVTLSLGPATFGLEGAWVGVVGALRLVAVIGANLAILGLLGAERILDGLRLPHAVTTFVAAVLLLAHDLGRDFGRLVDARRLEGRWPRSLRGRTREAVLLLPPLLVVALRRAEGRRDALRLAGHDTPPGFAPLVAVTALAAAGRLVLLGLPNIAFTYVVVFLGGLLFGPRIGFWAGLLSMLLTDLLLTGLLPSPLANAPAMALVGLWGAALRPIDFAGGSTIERWTGRALAFSAGVLGTMLFSAVADALTWLLVPEYRATPGSLRLLVLAGFAFNVVPALVNGVLFAASAGPVCRAFQALGSMGRPAAPFIPGLPSTPGRD
jgi:hypothetical protein